MQTIIYVLLFSAIFCGLAFSTRAQNFSEWWQQKKTRIKYLVAQVAALETFEKTMAKGYSQAEAGIDTFVVITNGEFHLHQAHFQSMTIVSSAVQYSPEAANCAGELEVLLEAATRFDEKYSGSLWLNPEQKNSIVQLYHSIVEEVNKTRNEILRLVTDNNLQMTDGERIIALQEIYNQSQRCAVCLHKLEEKVELIVSAKRRVAGEDTILKALE